jgi:hypothetical protein
MQSRKRNDELQLPFFIGRLYLLPMLFCCQGFRRIVALRLPKLGAVLSLLLLGMANAVGEGSTGQLPAGTILQARVAESDSANKLDAAVEALLLAFEEQTGFALIPGERGRVGLKVDTRAGSGLATPLALVRAVANALERRGFARQDIVVVDYRWRNMREVGLVPPISMAASDFEGLLVKALDQGGLFDDDWYYDSPLPSEREARPLPMRPQSDWRTQAFADDVDARKSFLNTLLLFETDFWINLPVYAHDPAIGVDGALSNATLWNVSNARRFLANPSTAAAAIAEIAAIPELRERMVFTLAPLWRYQFIGGPQFRSLYTRAEPLLWLSSDPVAMDRLMVDRFNFIRRLQGFPELSPIPSFIPFAASLGLGEDNAKAVKIVPVFTEE